MCAIFILVIGWHIAFCVWAIYLYINKRGIPFSAQINRITNRAIFKRPVIAIYFLDVEVSFVSRPYLKPRAMWGSFISRFNLLWPDIIANVFMQTSPKPKHIHIL